MKTPAAPTAENRYPGGNAFSEKDDHLFFGRQNDLEKLSDLIFIKQMVVLFGRSGYGKSSLINAGIVPFLKKQDEFLYLTIRFNSYQAKQDVQAPTPLETTIRKFSESVIAGENSLLFNNASDRDNSLWYWVKQVQISKPITDSSKFIIFFDQFEELFTYPAGQIAQFSEQLSQLLYGRIPAQVRQQLDKLDDIGVMSDEVYSFLSAKPDIKVVFSVRSDKLSLLNQLSERLPAILQNCYELGALTVDDAKLAITKPAELAQEGFKTQPFIFDPVAVDSIINSIINEADGKIEAATLQMICRYIEENLVIEKDIRYITKDLLGEITSVFQQYYQSVLNKLPAAERSKVQHFIEDELINANGRNALAEAYIQSRFGIGKNMLKILEQSSLLRTERDPIGRSIYEISHDSIVVAINRVAAVRRTDEAIQERRFMAEQLAKEQASNEKLTLLHKIARRRFLVSVVCLGMLFMATITAVHFSIKSHDEFNKFKTAQAKILQATRDKNKQEDLTNAQQVMNDADSYRRLNTAEYRDTACRRYNKALLIIKNYPNESLYKEINKKIAVTCAK
jgi:hypothetical protein